MESPRAGPDKDVAWKEKQKRPLSDAPLSLRGFLDGFYDFYRAAIPVVYYQSSV